MGYPKHRRVLARKQRQQGHQRNSVLNAGMFDMGTSNKCSHVAYRETFVIQLEKFSWQRQNPDRGPIKTYQQGSTHCKCSVFPYNFGKDEETTDLQAQRVILCSRGNNSLVKQHSPLNMNSAHSA